MLLEQLGIDTDKGLLQAYEEDIAPSLGQDNWYNSQLKVTLI